MTKSATRVVLSREQARPSPRKKITVSPHHLDLNKLARGKIYEEETGIVKFVVNSMATQLRHVPDSTLKLVINDAVFPD